MKIADLQIVGAMVAPRGKAAFDRANVVVALRSEPGRYAQVRAYVGVEDVEGKLLSSDDWTALIRAEQAIAIKPPADAAAGAAFWVLRASFAELDAALEELRTSGVLLRDLVRLVDGSYGCLVREPAANTFRDRWADAASAEALSWAKSGRWERAREAAARAFVLERAMTPERVAMLSLAYERCGRLEGAEGYIEMARRSRGADFAARVREKKLDLEQDTQEQAPRSGPRLRFAAEMQVASARGNKAGLDRLRRAR